MTHVRPAVESQACRLLDARRQPKGFAWLLLAVAQVPQRAGVCAGGWNGKCRK
jgi:hypothetical protein